MLPELLVSLRVCRVRNVFPPVAVISRIRAVNGVEYTLVIRVVIRLLLEVTRCASRDALLVSQKINLAILVSEGLTTVGVNKAFNVLVNFTLALIVEPLTGFRTLIAFNERLVPLRLLVQQVERGFRVEQVSLPERINALVGQPHLGTANTTHSKTADQTAETRPRGVTQGFFGQWVAVSAELLHRLLDDFFSAFFEAGATPRLQARLQRAGRQLPDERLNRLVCSLTQNTLNTELGLNDTATNSSRSSSWNVIKTLVLLVFANLTIDRRSG